MRKRSKLTLAEKKKRQARNERRARNAERQSEVKPTRAAPTAGAGEMRMRDLEASRASRQRSIMQTVDHATKWKDSPKCPCHRCVARRELEAEAENARKGMRARVTKDREGATR